MGPTFDPTFDPPSLVAPISSVDSLVEAVRTLSCLTRVGGQTRQLVGSLNLGNLGNRFVGGQSHEIAQVKSELARREMRMTELEEAVRLKEQERLALTRKHETLTLQLEEARQLKEQLDETRKARDRAEAQAYESLAGPMSARDLLAQEMQARLLLLPARNLMFHSGAPRAYALQHARPHSRLVWLGISDSVVYAHLRNSKRPKNGLSPRGRRDGRLP